MRRYCTSSVSNFVSVLSLRSHLPCHCIRACSRFLRARNYHLKQATLMWKNCQHWRNTVEGVGIDELYREIDPFDVRHITPVCMSNICTDHVFQYPERDHVFDCWPLYFHNVRPFQPSFVRVHLLTSSPLTV